MKKQGVMSVLLNLGIFILSVSGFLLACATMVGLVFFGVWLEIMIFRKMEILFALPTALVLACVAGLFEWLIFSLSLNGYSFEVDFDKMAMVERNGEYKKNVGPGRYFYLPGCDEFKPESAQPETDEFDVDDIQTSEPKNMTVRVRTVTVPLLEWLHLRLSWKANLRREEIRSKIRSFVSDECRKLTEAQVLDKSGSLADNVKARFEAGKIQQLEEDTKREYSIKLEHHLGTKLLAFYVVDPQMSPEKKKAMNEKDARITEAEGIAEAMEIKAKGEAAVIRQKGEALLGIAGAKGIRGADKNLLALLASGQGNPLYVSLNKEAAQAAHGLGQVGEGVMREGLGLLTKAVSGGRPDRGPRRNRDAPFTSPGPVPSAAAAKSPAPQKPPTKPSDPPVVLEPADRLKPTDQVQKVKPLGHPAKPAVQDSEVSERKPLQKMDDVLDVAIGDLGEVMDDQPKAPAPKPSGKPPNKTPPSAAPSEGVNCSEK